MAGDRVRVLENGIAVVRPATRAFLSDGVEAFQAQLAGVADDRDLVVDLSEVEARGDVSMGQRAIVMAYKARKAKGRRVLLAAPTPLMTEKLTIARFSLVTPVFDSIDEALAALAPPTAQAGQGRE